MTQNSFDIQELTITSDRWKVNLHYESWNSPAKTIEKKNDRIIIELSESGDWESSLRIDITDENSKRSCIVTGILGGTYLHSNDSDENCQSVKIDSDNLVLSLGLNFISINLNELKLNWNLKPDIAEVFEFYDLGNDYLLRGEIGIHRIDKSGNIKWTFTAGDIWVNMEGKNEVEIKENSIELFDFNSDHYVIDFNGKEIKN